MPRTGPLLVTLDPVVSPTSNECESGVVSRHDTRSNEALY